MNKSLILSAAAALTLAGSLLTLPAMAASPPAGGVFAPVICGSGNDVGASNDDWVKDSAALIAGELAAKGYSASRIENFGGCVRATIKNADGTSSMAYFTPDHLDRINVAG
jgi:hypothetical protein